jgi:hypothetical protein
MNDIKVQIKHAEMRIEHYEGIRLMAFKRNHHAMIQHVELSILELKDRIAKFRKSLFKYA